MSRMSRDKGRRGEIKVRNALRKLYSTREERELIHRVPMSGAGWMKGDIIDRNDLSWSYEVKNCETLSLPDWWRQTLAQTHHSQTPVLCFTSNFRPMYYLMRESDFDGRFGKTVYAPSFKKTSIANRAIYKKLEATERLEFLILELEGENTIIMSEEDFINLRKDEKDGYLA